MTTVITTYEESVLGSRAKCQLSVVDGPDMGRAVALDQKEITVGTATDCGLVLQDERVSQHHVSILASAQGFVVRDLGSKNGVLYEGARITSSTVQAGATLKVGRTFLRILPRPQTLAVTPSSAHHFGDLVGKSLAMREIFAVLELAAESDVTVLLEGETGCGKELAARALHDASARRRGPFVAIDCGALSENLLESELFGHIRGAFTGASHSRAGAFVRANKGTLFLDELSGVSQSVQSRLLRVLEERRVRPVGADRETEIDVRVVGAAKSDLSTQVAEGAFRPDLFYRLSVMRVVLPTLRARREDIALIVAAMLRRKGVEPGEVSGAGLDRLMAHSWPGNVRELRNVIDRAIALTPGAKAFAALKIAVDGDSAAPAASVRSDLPFAEAKRLVVEHFEASYLRDLFARCAGNVSAMARAADVDRKHLSSLLLRHGLLSPKPAARRR